MRDRARRAWIAGLLAVVGTAGAAEAQSGATRGEVLFQRQCAVCHGAAGRADGPASYLLFPPPRDFGRGRFELTSTSNGAPTDADLVAVLRRGIPGSSMPSWDWMPDEDLRALAEHVRTLAVEGLAEDLRAEEDLSAEESLAAARERMTPGDPVPVGEPAPATPEVLARGEAYYAQECAACHGADGTGRHEIVRRDEDETLNWARDFTRGVLAGGATHADLVRRIRVGMHGTAMPAGGLDGEQLAELVAHVRSLVAEGAEDRLVQRRRTITAARMPDGALEVPDRVDWSRATEVEVNLAPLWWRPESILHARVAAVHDGERIALRVRWDDERADAPTDLEWPLDAPPYADAVALQISPQAHPPYFGMGEEGAAASLWHWRALETPPEHRAPLWWVPHRMRDWLGGEVLDAMPVYQRARGPVHVEGEAVSVRPAGMRDLESQDASSAPLYASASWNDGTWEVVFERALEARGRAATLRADANLSLNLAIWNGAARDHRAQKSVTIWHALELEP